MEANIQTFLDEVDSKLKSVGQLAEAKTSQAQLTAHLGFMEVEKAWEKMKTEIAALATRVHEVQAKPKAALEEGQIELYFGVEDAKEAFARLRERLEATERSMAELGSTASGDMKAALVRLQDAYEAIKNKLLH
jgi:hypothetical protein